MVPEVKFVIFQFRADLNISAPPNLWTCQFFMCNIQTNQETWQEIFYYILRQSDGPSFGMHALSPSHGQKDHEQDVPRKKNPNFISNWNSVWNFNRLWVSLVSTDEFATELPQTIKIFTFVILAWWSLIRFLLTSRSCNIKKSRSFNPSCAIYSILSLQRRARARFLALPLPSPRAKIELHNFGCSSLPLARGSYTRGLSYREVRYA